MASTDSNLATVYVCITCRRASDPDAEPRPGALLADATASAAQGSGIAVRRVRCLANCTRGPSAAVRRTAAATPTRLGPTYSAGSILRAQRR